MAGNDLRRDCCPLSHECVATHQLQHKNNDIDDHDAAVTMGTRAGRRDASPNGATPPILPSSVSVNAGFRGRAGFGCEPIRQRAISSPRRPRCCQTFATLKRPTSTKSCPRPSAPQLKRCVDSTRSYASYQKNET